MPRKHPKDRERYEPRNWNRFLDKLKDEKKTRERRRSDEGRRFAHRKDQREA
jgi:hypothetical protein